MAIALLGLSRFSPGHWDAPLWLLILQELFMIDSHLCRLCRGTGDAWYSVLFSTHSGAIEIEAGVRLPVQSGLGKDLYRHINLAGYFSGRSPGSILSTGFDMGWSCEHAGSISLAR